MAPTRVGAVLRLARVQTMALTALAPVIGAAVFYALAPGGVWHAGIAWDLALLFATGACFHVFGFVLNEWADVDVDRASGDLRGKPLVSGAVDPRRAFAGALIAGMLGYVPLAYVSTTPWPLLLYTFSLVLGGAYDIWGKKAPLDAVLAGSLSALLLSGVSASGRFDPSDPWQLWLLLALLALQFLQNLFQNAIEGGIKDADHDADAGARTFAAVTGTRVEDGEYRPSRAFIAAAVATKSLNMVILVLVAWYMSFHGYSMTALVLMGTLLALALAVMAWTLASFLPRGRFDRPRLKRLFSAHEMATFVGTVAILLPLLGWPFTSVLIALPVLWFLGANVALFGRPLEPGV